MSTKGKYIYNVHTDEIRAVPRNIRMIFIVAAAIIGVLSTLWILQTAKGNLSFKIFTEALAFGEFVFVMIFAIPYTLESVRMVFIRGRLISECVTRLEKANLSILEINALQQEAEAAKSDVSNWTLLLFFILSLFWGAINTIMTMSLGNGSLLLFGAIFLFIGIIETMIEGHAASILARALIRYRFLRDSQVQAFDQSNSNTSSLLKPTSTHVNIETINNSEVSKSD